MKLSLPKRFKKTRVNVVRLAGTIAPGARFGGDALNDDSLAPLLDLAFRKGNPVAVALAVNSPGGSPVQSSLIGARIRRLSDETKVPVFAFCEDVAASGGYWLAAAADEILVDESSVMGSIGVISASFGFHELMQRQGVERRVYTAGEDKSMLDPFRPENPKDIERLKDLQLKIHQNFIDYVTARRGDKLKGDDLFTGEIWIGQAAVENGLADGIGHLVPTLKDRFGDKTQFRAIGQKKSFLRRLGMGSASDLMASVEDRAVWARFGL